MRQAIGAAAAALALGWMCGSALAGPVSPTLALQVQESWQTSTTKVVKGKKTTVITNNSASSGVIMDVGHTGRVEFQTAPHASFGTFSSLSAIGLGDPLIGSGLDDEIDLSSQLAAAKLGNVVAGSIVLDLLLTETGLTTDHGTLPFAAEIGGTLGHGMVLGYQTFVDPGNHAFAETDPLTIKGFPTSGAFSWDGGASQSLNGQFSMTEQVTIQVPTSAAASGTSFDASLSTTVVPEPATAMMLWLPLGVLGIAVATRKSRRPV